MPKQRTFCFTKPTEMHGILAPTSWAHKSMREAINMGTGPWFCIFVDGKFRATVEMSQFLVKLGFSGAYEFVKQEKDAKKLADAALQWRGGKCSHEQFSTVRTGIENKYGRRFESRPLLVANRLASDNACTVASALCLDGVGTDFQVVTGAIIDYARRVIRP